MDRKFLEGLGLEKETIDKVMVEHGKSLNDYKEKADKHDGLVTQIGDLTDQLKERDGQLEELKKVDADALKQRIVDLQTENENNANEYQEKIDKQAKDFAIESYLRDQKARNPKAVKALLDLESITLKDDKLIGIDEQVTPLKESDDYLFKQEEQQQTKSPNILVGGNPQGSTHQTKSIAEMSYEELTELKANNPAQFAELTK